MFSGIIAHTGKIESIEATPKGKRFLVSTQFQDLTEGESISVDGVCLTVTDIDGSDFHCDLSPETLAKTVAGDYQVGHSVNLERALLVSDRIGGHWVTGHVDETATLVELEELEEFWRLRFEPEHSSALNYVVEKGSIALSGVSLTINEVDKTSFSVMLIPHTLLITNLKNLEINHKINVEYDMLAKIVAKQVQNMVLND